MRLTRAGWVLVIFLLIACPFASVVSYAALSGRSLGSFDVGGFGFGGTDPTRTVAAAETATFAVTPASGNRPRDTAVATQNAAGAGSGAAPTPTTTPVLGVVPVTPSVTVGPAIQGTATAAAPVLPGRTPTAGGMAGSPSGGPAVTVAYDAFAPYYPVRIARTQGYAQRRGIALREVPFDLDGQNAYTEEERWAALREGRFDVLLTTLNAVALFNDERTGKVVALVDESAGADKIVAREPIARINDLRGKRIAFSNGSVSEFFLYASLNLAGLTVADVSPVPIRSVDEAARLFTRGEVDAVVGWEPAVAEAVRQPGARTLIGSDTYRAILDVIVVSDRALAEKPDAIQAFLDAWFEGVKLTTDDPAAAGAAVVASGDTAWTGVAQPADLREQLTLVAQATLAQNQFALSDPATLGGRIRENQALWRAGGKNVSGADPARMVDTRFVQRSAGRPELASTQPPVNASFVLTSRIQLPPLTPEQLGRSQAVAELPLKFIAFQPDSTMLSEQGRRDLLEQVVPVLRRTPGLYLRVDGSAAKLPTDSDAAHEAFARDRARAVISFLISQGIDANRLIEGYLPPQFPNTLNEEERRQDRRVVFTLVQPGGR